MLLGNYRKQQQQDMQTMTGTTDTGNINRLITGTTKIITRRIC